MNRLKDLLFSLKTTIILLVLLGIGAAVATFIENDFGTSSARVLVYNSWWYELLLILAGVNLAGVIYRRKMWKQKARFVFHLGFLVILLGAGLTRYAGEEGILHIREGKSENRMLSAETYLQVTIHKGNNNYYKEYKHDFTAVGSDKNNTGAIASFLGDIANDFEHKIDFGGEMIDVSYAGYKYAKKGQASMGLVSVKVCYGDKCDTQRLVGQRGMKGVVKQFNFGDVKVDMEFGSRVLELPFKLKLLDFKLERYPGSMAPSSYASKVEMLDGDKHFEYDIYMNHTLDYRGYKFFQSSYDQDELGTILSVNDDPGKWPTYIGYLLLAVGFFWNFFVKDSRFAKLTQYIKSTQALSLLLVMFASANMLHGSDGFGSYIEAYKSGSLQSAEKFSHLMVQAPMGRMEPIDTLDKELLYKVHGSNSFEGLNYNQVIMGMLSSPEAWRDAKLIKVKSPKLKKLLGVAKTQKYVSFSDAFKDKEYKLKNEIEKASRMNPNRRGTYERGLIALDERLNVIYMIFYGNAFNIYPLVGDTNNKWYNPLEANSNFTGQSKSAVQMMTTGFIEAANKGEWKKVDTNIDYISMYQHKFGANVIPGEQLVNVEIMYNKSNIFQKLLVVYLMLGFLLLIVGFLQVLSNKKSKIFKTIDKASAVVLGLLFLVHTFGLGMIWYISGHAPWTNSYESLLYISWSAMLAGLVFFRRSLLVFSAAVIVAGIFMGTAHMSHINPQITNLVPVLKSYWLTIHVSIITASYGFLGLGAVLGYIVLIMFIFRSPKREHIDVGIHNLVAVGEAALIIGLAMLTVGNFLGGVWANESWGRYWGWDPKETWAYISIVAYSAVLHFRLIKSLDNPYVFAVASFLVFSTILMTYFGVNFYLSGMHSYATGDPLPIPSWVYYLTALAFVTILLAYPKRGLGRLKLKSVKS